MSGRDDERRICEGTLFAVPLEGGFMLGLVARSTGSIAFGFFFGPLRDEVPHLAEVPDLTDEDALLAARFATGALEAGEWPLIGILPSWSRTAWAPMVTVRHDYLTGTDVGVSYEDDAVMPVAEEPLAPHIDICDLPSDDIFNESHLKKVLASSVTS